MHRRERLRRHHSQEKEKKKVESIESSMADFSLGLNERNEPCPWCGRSRHISELQANMARLDLRKWTDKKCKGSIRAGRLRMRGCYNAHVAGNTCGHASSCTPTAPDRKIADNSKGKKKRDGHVAMCIKKKLGPDFLKRWNHRQNERYLLHCCFSCAPETCVAPRLWNSSTGELGEKEDTHAPMFQGIPISMAEEMCILILEMKSGLSGVSRSGKKVEAGQTRQRRTIAQGLQDSYSAESAWVLNFRTSSVCSESFPACSQR